VSSVMLCGGDGGAITANEVAAHFSRFHFLVPSSTTALLSYLDLYDLL